MPLFRRAGAAPLHRGRWCDRVTTFVKPGLTAGTILICAQALAAASPPSPNAPPPRAIDPPASVGRPNDPLSPAPPWQTALEGDPGNPVAWRLTADFLEWAGDSHAIEARRQVVVSEPEPVENRFALIDTALRFGDLPTAQCTLDDLAAISPPARAYADAAAAVAFASGYADTADDLLNAVSREERDQKALRIARATLRLRFGGPKQVPIARKQLYAFLNTHETVPAVRQDLVADALRNADEPTALQLCDEVADQLDAPFAHQLRRADVLLACRRKEFDAVRESLAARAVQTPASAALFANWLIARENARAASAWLETLPKPMIDAAEVRTARADCFAALQDWGHALQLIKAGAWGTIAPDLVSRAHAVRQLEPGEGRSAAWDEVLRAAGSDPGALRVLHRLALTGKMEPQSEATLFAIARSRTGQGWALQALADRFLREKDTPKLQALYALWHKSEPDNVTVESHLLLLNLLTTRKPSPELRTRIDQFAMYHPDQPLLQTARALALWQLGRPQEALTATENIRSKDRHFASRAFYHALFTLTVGGRTDEAEQYLALSEKVLLLPEESNLVQTARAMIASAQAKQ